MRALMLTTDRAIDRRILQQAETLIDSGREVILIAGRDPDQRRFERIGRVKVERLSRDLADQPAPLHTLGGALRRLLETWAGERSSIRHLGRALRSALTLSVRLPATAIEALAGVSVGRAALLPSESAVVSRAEFYNPDVICVHDLPRLRAGATLAGRLNVPLVYDAHELYPEIGALTPRQRWVLSRMERTLVRRCDHISTVNHFIADEMARRYHIDPPTVIHNAIDPPAGFEPGGHDRFRSEFDIPADGRILLYQGWLSPTRGLQTLVRSMTLTDDRIHLVLMGYGEMRAELERIAREADAGGRVHFKAAVPQAELLSWTASADAGVIPYPPTDLNKRFCSPNKLFEFIQAGVPLIANDLPFLREVVGGEGFGVIAELGSEQQFAAAISEMFDPARGGAERFRPAIAAQAGAYTWAGEVPKLLAIHDGIAAACISSSRP